MKKALIIIIMFSSILLAQGQNDKLNSSYITAKLIKGIPISLKNNGFFSQQGNISYSVIYKNKTDSMYFIIKKINNDTSTFVLVCTSGGRITSYDFFSFKKTADNKLIAEDDIKDFNIKLFYLTEANILQYKVLKKNDYEIPKDYIISKPKSEYDAFFELGVRDEVIITKNQSSGPSLHNIQFIFGCRFLKYYKIDMKLGYMMITNILTGMDEGIFFKAGLFKTDIYISTGIDILSMMGQLPHGLSSGMFFYYGLGIGYDVSRQFSLDAMYYIPGSREIVYHDLFNPGAAETTINHDLISIGFQISFIFN